MEGLNLANLNINVRATGVEEAERQIDGLTNSVQQSNTTTQSSTSGMRTAFTNLTSSIRNSFNNVSIFGTTIGSLRTQFSNGAGAAAILQGAIGGLTSSFINLAMKGIQTALSALKDFIGNGIELASDLQEIQNVLDTTFGENADEVNEWCINLGSNFGLTELQAKKFSSTIGAVFSGMGIAGEQAKEMSINMTQLTGDLASFYNLDHEEAFTKIKAGITGETEPLKSLGIVMTEANLSAYAMKVGIDKAYRSMSEQEKTLLRYNYLIEQTSLAHGDFAKTADSYANSSKTLSNAISSIGAEIGKGLLPVLSEIKADLTELVQKLSPIFSFIGGLVGGLLQALYALLKPIIELVKMLLKLLEPVFNALTKILAVANEMLTKCIKGIGDLFKKIGENLGLIGEGVEKATEYTTEKIVDETNNALGYVENAVEKWVDDQMDAYEEKLRNRYGKSGTLANELAIQKQLQTHEERLRAQAERTSTAIQGVEKRKREAIEKTNKEIERQIELFTHSGTSVHNGKGGTSKSFATGTSYHTGGYAMVGEYGRELVELPRGSKVYNNRQTENILSGSGSNTENNTFNISINASNVKELNDVINMCNSYKQNLRMG